MLKKLWDKVANEPVLIYNLVNVCLVAGVTFGMDLSGEQVAALMAVTTAVLNVVARQMVTPTRKFNA